MTEPNIIREEIVVACARYHNALLDHAGLGIGKSTSLAAKEVDEAEAALKAYLDEVVEELEVYAYPDDQKYADSTVKVVKAVLRRKLGL